MPCLQLPLSFSPSPPTARPPHASSRSQEEWDSLMHKHGATPEAMEARKLAAGHPDLTYVPLDAWQYEPTQVRSDLQSRACALAQLGMGRRRRRLLPPAWTAAALRMTCRLLCRVRTHAVRPISTLAARVAQQAHLGFVRGAVRRRPPAGSRRVGPAQ